MSTLGERPVMMGGKNIGRKYTAFRDFTEALGRHPYEEFGINTSRVKDGQVQTFATEDGGTQVVWTYSLEARNALAISFIWLFMKTVHRSYVEAAMTSMRQIAESEGLVGKPTLG